MLHFLCFSMYVMRFHNNDPVGPKGVGSVLRWLECLQTAIHFTWFLFVSIIFLSDSIREMNINLRVLYFWIWHSRWQSSRRLVVLCWYLDISFFLSRFVLFETQTEICQISQNCFPYETLVCHLKARLECSPQHLRKDADKSLARPGRKQTAATKLEIYSTYSPRSSIYFFARCSNLCKPLEKKNSEGCPFNQVSAAAMTSMSDEKWRPFNWFFTPGNWW